MTAKVRVCVNLDADLADRLDEFCNENVVGRSFVVRRALEIVLAPSNGDVRRAIRRRWWHGRRPPESGQ